MNLTVPPDSDPNFTRKVMCLRLARKDYATLLEMYEAAEKILPFITCPDDVVAAIVTDYCRLRREKQAVGERLALPGTPS